MTSTQGFPNARMAICGTNLASMQNLRTVASAVMLGPGAGMAGEVQLQLDVGAADAAELHLLQKPGPLAHCHILQLGGRNAVIALLDGLSREVLMWHAAGHLLSARLQGALRHRPLHIPGPADPAAGGAVLALPGAQGRGHAARRRSAAGRAPVSLARIPARRHRHAAGPPARLGRRRGDVPRECCSALPRAARYRSCNNRTDHSSLHVQEHWVGGTRADGQAVRRTAICAPALVLFHTAGDGSSADTCCVPTPLMNALLLTTNLNDAHKTLCGLRCAPSPCACMAARSGRLIRQLTGRSLMQGRRARRWDRRTQPAGLRSRLHGAPRPLWQR